MNVVMMQADPGTDTVALQYVMAVIAAFFTAGLGMYRLQAGQGCLIFALIMLWGVTGASLGARGHFAASALLVGAGYALAWGTHRERAKMEAEAREREEQAAREDRQKREAALRKQRAGIPPSAEQIGLATYRGGLPEMQAGQAVHLLVARTRLFLVPDDPFQPAAQVDVSRPTHLWVAEATGSVVLATDAGGEWPLQVEFGPSEGGLATARDLYARLARLLPRSAAPANASTRPFAIPCTGCGAAVPRHSSGCLYCGRPA